MQPYEQRVVDEKAALDVKIGALRTFMEGSMYRSLVCSDRSLLVDQLHTMSRYSDILAERISRFPT